MQRALAILLVTLLAAVAGWSFVWSAAAGKTGAILDAWIENESQLGRNWTCPGRNVGGYPLSIEVACPGLQFHGAVGAADLAGSLRGFRAAASVFQPDRVTVQLASPFAGRTADGNADLRVDWTRLDLVIEGRPDALARLSIDGAQVEATGSTGGAGAFDAKARSLQASAAPTPEARDPALDFQIALNGVVSPALTDLLGLEAPLDAMFQGTISRVAGANAGHLADRLERWRVEGGVLELKTAQLTSGASKLSGGGVLNLDEAHRPRGKLDAAFEGLSPILRRLGVDPQIISASSLLTRFLRESPGKADGGDAVRLPLRFNEGFVWVGPLRTPLRLPPLY